jgi:hypothetical protein
VGSQLPGGSQRRAKARHVSLFFALVAAACSLGAGADIVVLSGAYFMWLVLVVMASSAVFEAALFWIASRR